MADPEKADTTVGSGVAEEEKLLEGVAVLDFDVLCSTVAMQTQGKWRKLDDDDDDEFGDGVGGGVLRMWEGELLDCFDDRRIALESTCCPCFRFGKNMGRAGFGPCFAQGFLYLIFAAALVSSSIAFIVTNSFCFLYMAIAFIIWIGAYLGFFRTLMRKKFNIRGGDNLLDDCLYHLICPCCTLSQESRTLEMNNVQDGTWQGRGDTICIGGESSKKLYELRAPSPILVTKSTTETFSSTNGSDKSPQVEHSVVVVPSSQ